VSGSAPSPYVDSDRPVCANSGHLARAFRRGEMTPCWSVPVRKECATAVVPGCFLGHRRPGGPTTPAGGDISPSMRDGCCGHSPAGPRGSLSWRVSPDRLKFGRAGTQETMIDAKTFQVHKFDARRRFIAPDAHLCSTSSSDGQRLNIAARLEGICAPGVMNLGERPAKRIADRRNRATRLGGAHLKAHGSSKKRAAHNFEAVFAVVFGRCL
jgi:hypothetical protein